MSRPLSSQLLLTTPCSILPRPLAWPTPPTHHNLNHILWEDPWCPIFRMPPQPVQVHSAVGVDQVIALQRQILEWSKKKQSVSTGSKNIVINNGRQKCTLLLFAVWSMDLVMIVINNIGTTLPHDRMVSLRDMLRRAQFDVCLYWHLTTLSTSSCSCTSHTALNPHEVPCSAGTTVPQ